MGGFVFDLVFGFGAVTGAAVALVLRAEVEAARRRPGGAVDTETYREVRCGRH